METKKQTKKQMVEAIQKTMPWKSNKFMMKWTVAEVKKSYEEAKELGLIKEDK